MNVSPPQAQPAAPAAAGVQSAARVATARSSPALIFRHRWYWIALPCVVVAGVVSAMTWLTSGPAAPSLSGADDEVIYQTVGVMQVSETSNTWTPHRYTATVVPRRTSRLGFEASERVIEILVDEGDSVTRGQVLAKQDATVLQSRVSAAAASLAQAEALLAELIQGPRRETINAARSELVRLKNQVKLAEVTLKRQKSMRASNAGSAQEYDTARFETAATRAAVDSAAHRLAELESGTRKEKIDAQRATVDFSRAALQQAKIRLKQTVLRAPFSGKIAKRLGDEGALPARGEAILEIIESDQLEVRFGAALAIAAGLKSGDIIPFTAANQQFEGTLAQVSARLDTATRTREVIVNLSPGDANSVVAGQTVKIEFALPSNQPGFWLPSEALQPQVRGLWSVLVANRNTQPRTSSVDGPPAVQTLTQRPTVVRRDVEVLSTWGSWSRVRGTLSAGEQVIVQGAARVSPGQRVETRPVQLTPPWKNSSTVLGGPHQVTQFPATTPIKIDSAAREVR